MAIYEIQKDGNLKPIKSMPFANEDEIHRISEENLNTIFGLEFVRREFPINNFRIDTLAFDPQNNAFVIIEYKKDESFSVIDQGYAYLGLMLNNKADFILEYNNKMQEPLNKSDIDWSQSRVMFISPVFTIYQKESINFKNLPIELWEIKKFTNNFISYNKIKPAKSAEDINIITKGSKVINKISNEIKTYTEEDLLRSSSSKIKTAFSSIKEVVYNLDGEIDEKVGKTMVNFTLDDRGLVFVRPQKKKIRLWLRKGKYKDKNDKLLPKGWGGYPFIYFSEDEFDIDYIKELIKQACEY